MNVFRVYGPSAAPVPLLLSIPHCGTFVPEDLCGEFDPELLSTKDDTDFFVDRLYDFAPGIGATVLAANVSRWVIDLNRDPADKPLYSDGRVITGLCPVTDFTGKPLYRDQRKSVAPTEIQQRLQDWYWPYHQELERIKNSMLDKHGAVIIWECHSIRRSVPAIHPEDFPDLILGDAGGRSAAPRLTESALNALSAGSYQLAHNHPFQGGYITRHFGNPAKNIHALQLEMTKVNYLKDDETTWDETRASAMQSLLQSTLSVLTDSLPRITADQKHQQIIGEQL